MYSAFGVLCTVVSIFICCNTHSFPLFVLIMGSLTSVSEAPTLRTFCPGFRTDLARACLNTLFCNSDGALGTVWLFLNLHCFYLLLSPHRSVARVPETSLILSTHFFVKSGFCLLLVPAVFHGCKADMVCLYWGMVLHLPGLQLALDVLHIFE